MHRSRAVFLLVILFGLAAVGGIPAAMAQSTVKIGVESAFQSSETSLNSSIPEILARGTTVRATGESLVLIVAQVSRGRLVARSATDAFRIDPRAAEQGVVLGSMVSRRQIEGLKSVRQVAREVGRHFVMAARPVSAVDLVEQSGVSFMAVLEDAFGYPTGGGGGYGGGGAVAGFGGGSSEAYGGGSSESYGGAGGAGYLQSADYLVVAAAPADPRLRSRSTVEPLIIIH
jgi:hypothetical protein